MPTVPTVTSPRPGLLPTQNVGGATPDAFGAGVARAEQGAAQAEIDAGNSIVATGDTLRRIVDARLAASKARDDEREAKQGFLNLNSSLDEVTKDAFGARGQNALDLQESTLSEVDRLSRDSTNFGSNQRVNDSVSSAFGGSILQKQKQLRKHFSSQKRVVEDEQTANLIKAATDKVIAHPTLDSDFPLGLLSDLTSRLNSAEALDPESADSIRLRGDIALVESNADPVGQGEDQVRKHAEDKANRKGLDAKAAGEEAVATFFVDVIQARLKKGDTITALRVFNANRLKITGQRGVDLEVLVRDETEKDISLSMSRSIADAAFKLPQDKRDGFIQGELRKIGSLSLLILVRAQTKAQISLSRRVEEAGALDPAKREVIALKNQGKTSAQIRSIINKTENGALKDAKLVALAEFEKEADIAKQSVAEIFVNEHFTVNGRDPAKTEAAIDEQLKDPATRKIARKILVGLAGVRDLLKKTDSAVRAEERTKSIITSVSDDRLSIEQQRANAIGLTDDLPPGERASVITAINTHFNSIKAAKTENDDATVLRMVAALNEGGSVEKIPPMLAPKVAIAIKKDLKDREDIRRLDVSETLRDANTFVEGGGSVEKYKLENPEGYKLLVEDGAALTTLKNFAEAFSTGVVHLLVSDPGTLDRISRIPKNKLADQNPDDFSELLSPGDFTKFSERVEGAIFNRDTKNTATLASIRRLAETTQPFDDKGRKQLNDSVIEDTILAVSGAMSSRLKAGLKVDEFVISKTLISAFTKLKSSPDGFFDFFSDPGRESIEAPAGAFFNQASEEQIKDLELSGDIPKVLRSRALAAFRSIGGEGTPTEEEVKDLATRIIKTDLGARIPLAKMSVSQLESIIFDVRTMPAQLIREATEAFRRFNKGLEPTELDTEIYGKNIIDARLRDRGK